jgi:hypothetical protein
MTTSAEYFRRPEECARLANPTIDDFIKRDMLALRQHYLMAAAWLQSAESSKKSDW